MNGMCITVVCILTPITLQFVHGLNTSSTSVTPAAQFDCGDVCEFDSSGTCISEFNFCIDISSVTQQCPPGFTPCPNMSQSQGPSVAPTEVPSELLLSTMALSTISSSTNEPPGVPDPTTPLHRAPTGNPTPVPTSAPTAAPSVTSTDVPSETPSTSPSREPTTISPTPSPTPVPTVQPSASPTVILVLAECTGCIATSAGPCRSIFAFCLPLTTVGGCPPGFDPCYVGDVPLDTTATTTVSTSVTPAPTALPTNVPFVLTTESSTAAPQHAPTGTPTFTPSAAPSAVPTSNPTFVPTELPTTLPTSVPSSNPTIQPTTSPSHAPVVAPTLAPTRTPSLAPTDIPTSAFDCATCFATSRGQCKNVFDFCVPFQAGTMLCPPGFGSCTASTAPTATPTTLATATPTPTPTAAPSSDPSNAPSLLPTVAPTQHPTSTPTLVPSTAPTEEEFTMETTNAPTAVPTSILTPNPTDVFSTTAPTESTTEAFLSTMTPITASPTATPTAAPTQTAPPTSPTDCTECFATSAGPCKNPFGFCIQYLAGDTCPQGFDECALTHAPSVATAITEPPTSVATSTPSSAPSDAPTVSPSVAPTGLPSQTPTAALTASPSQSPSATPTTVPTLSPLTTPPTHAPVASPTVEPSSAPSRAPTGSPTGAPTWEPTATPSHAVTATPTQAPTIHSDCMGCFASSSGPCQNAFQFCFHFAPGTTDCPPGFTLCTPSTEAPSETGSMHGPTDLPTESPSASPMPNPTVLPTVYSSVTPPDPTWPLPTTSESALVCPSNCGRESSGGGTCELSGGQVLCTSCNTDRVLHLGRCQSTLYCRGNRVRNAALLDERCRCSIGHCFYCDITATGETCRKCRDGFYRLNETCHESCPATLASNGISLYGRECFPAFTCVSNRAQISGETVTCKCPLRDAPDSPLGNCHNCSFEVGGFGGVCNRCRNSKFLYNHSCYDDCTMAPATFVAYDIGSYGRRCRAPFTCTNTRDDQGVKCKCPAAVGGGNCGICDWGVDVTTSATRVVCTQCKNNRFLHNDACLSRCPSDHTGVVPVVRGATGRECVLMA